MATETQTVSPETLASLEKIKKYDRTFFGHPLGLLILSMNEIWERFSFYGMKAILIYFMIAPVEKGGMGMPHLEAASVFGLYSCVSGLMILPGGWISDVIMGQRRALFWGGVVILVGHLSMAFPHVWLFYLGMGLIILGTALLKPSSAGMVVKLYPPGDPRQDAGYTIYYMCINVGALMGAVVCGYLGQNISWHLGFGAAAVGMFLGIIVYRAGYRFIGDIGRLGEEELDPVYRQKNIRRFLFGIFIVGAVVCAMVLCNTTGILPFTFAQLNRVIGAVLIPLPVIYFVYVLRLKHWTSKERRNLGAIGLLFFFAIFFAAAGDLRGSLYAFVCEDLLDRKVFGFDFPASWFPSFNSLFVITLTPIFAWLWAKLGKEGISTPGKFAWGMFFCAASFGLIIAGLLTLNEGNEKLGPQWMIVNVFLFTVGEMFLQPVGMSAFARLAPKSMSAQVIGIWYLRGSIAGLIAGYSGGAYKSIPLLTNFGLWCVGTTLIGVLILILTPTIKRLMK